MANHHGALASPYRCTRCLIFGSRSVQIFAKRSFSARQPLSQNIEESPAAQNVPASPPLDLDPERAFKKKEEQQLLQAGMMPIGSRRRRAALAGGSKVPFEHLPYQCFQEARNLLSADREEKVRAIEIERQRIARLEAQKPYPDGTAAVEVRLKSMRKHLENLKIQADINDPIVKKRFEDGMGDMNKPIYRYLANRKWRSYRRPLLIQRITQMNVIPDVLPSFDPVVDVTISFSGKTAHPGEFVYSALSEKAPQLQIQPFTQGEKLVSVAVVDSDVPNLDMDRFSYRCHFLASNIKISPTSTLVDTTSLSPETHVVVPWLPPFAQKGSPYHRLSVIVFQQPDNQSVDLDAARTNANFRDGFILRSFADKHKLEPIGVGLFRSQWDEGTDGVMQKAGIEGADIEFKNKRLEPLPYKRKAGARFR